MLSEKDWFNRSPYDVTSFVEIRNLGQKSFLIGVGCFVRETGLIDFKDPDTDSDPDPD